MVNPYYQDKWATIYLGDCLEVMPQLEPVDLVLTDPPYNANKDYGTYKDNLSHEEYQVFMQDVVVQARILGTNQFWVAPRYKLPFFLSLMPEAHLVVIRRGARGPFRGGWSDQFEIALASGKPAKCISDLWEDIRLKGEGYFFWEETFGHPGYTPYSILARGAFLLSEESLCDPFCGTGTALVAAAKLNRKAIGIEIEEKYCEIAVRRLAQEVIEWGP